MKNVAKLAPSKAREAIAVLEQAYAYYMPERHKQDDESTDYLAYPMVA